MCGISGIFGPGSSDPRMDRAVQDSLQKIRHRGPDQSGMTTVGAATLGMTRLAVMDPAGGHQPLQSADGAVTLVFNGEIYNFRELRAPLEAAGHVFRTSSDTEVLLASYLEHGRAAVADLVGMFAFAIHDARTGELLLGRDRFGKKPLYYSDLPEGGLCFSSELKGLLPILERGGVKPGLSAQGIYDYLSLGVVPQPQTIYEGVHCLTPGTTMRIGEGRRRQEEIFWAPDFTKSPAHPIAKVREQVRSLVRDATRVRLRSDVPLGVFLSGGVDSSVIAYETSLVVGSSLESFTVKSAGELDESDVAARTARALGIKNTVLPLTMDPVRGVHDVVTAYDQPFADSSAIPSMAISRLAREHVTVVLNGDGGDEVFGGYRRHVAAHLATRHARWVAPAGRLAERLIPASAARRGPLGFGLRLARGLGLDPAERYLAWTTDMLREGDKRDAWRGPACLPTERIVTQTLAPGLSGLDQQLASDTRINLLSDLLVKMDMATMAYSLEGRSPLLDHRLADYVWSLPDTQRLPRGRPKGLLRDTYRGLLSDEVISGKKRGFEIPMASWLDCELAPMVQDLVVPSSARVKGFLDPVLVDAVMLGQGMPERNTTYLRYALLVLELWLRQESQ
ncbi:asparagine synthase (glutamine-hydrolyzing) [Ornithinimicrobium cryptoxanthini]|uniref:asparagine synthase (glutamine-hydrolyzing) n=1 Tax=Ornithinimicrobium cryptoxanthini TaxID=2934161 RepID=UPI002118A8E2|nr:asparagine synthase (glutamine-hydrolyzing) [Ornithinimicrobium cryptoxanthini]